MADFKKAQRVANEILEDNFITKPPVPVVDLVKNYGYEVKETDLPANIAGLVDPKKRIIYLNTKDSDNRKAFTVAHELGHIKLHATELETNPNVGILYRRPLGEKDPNEKEQEANCFAASLLVPEGMLKEIMEQYKKVLTENNKVELLSSLFGVSPEVIGYRLHDMNLKN